MISFRDIIGHEAPLARLRVLARSRALGSAYLLHGPSGVGKHRAAMAFAAAILCEGEGADACGTCGSCGRIDRGNEPHLMFPETSGKKDTITKDSVVEVQRALSLLPMTGRPRVCVMDEAERIMEDAANALLKTLEESPKNTVFLLVAANPERLLPTIVSRCQSIRFGPLSPEDVVKVLRGQEVPAAEAATLASLADGRPGEALRLRESGALDRRIAFLTPFADKGPTAPWIDSAVAAAKGGSGSYEGIRGRSKELLGFFAEPLRLALRERCGAGAAAGTDELGRRCVEGCARLGDPEELAGLLEGLLAAQRAFDQNANAALWIEHSLAPILEAGDRAAASVR